MQGISSADKLTQIAAGTHARINLDAYTRNIERLTTMLPLGTALMVVVKADAYGHGAVECSKAALQAGATMLGVARIAEALALRRRGVTGDILVLGPPNLAEVALAIQHDIAITIGSVSSIGPIKAHVEAASRPLRVHLKVDTGMHRFGVHPDDAPRSLQLLGTIPDVTLDGVFTHFASADEADDEPTRMQSARFEQAIASIRSVVEPPRWIHLANSAGTLSGRFGVGNLVRCGIATYGLSPSSEVSVPDEFEPVMSLVSRVGRRFTLEAGEGVSYGLTYRSDRPEELATIPIGYADGVTRDLSNRGWFVANGTRLPIRGRICMDQTVVGNAHALVEGDEVIVIGSMPGTMTLDDAAAMTGTINYELATRVMARVPRIYYRGGQPVAWDHMLLGERGYFGT